VAETLKPNGFWSYSRDDDERSRGKLSQLRSLLQTELQGRFPGHDRAHIFQDLAGISYGEAWKKALETALDDCSFFIPIVTPGFLLSEWCGLEVLRFQVRMKKLGRDDLIFPIHYIDVDDVDPGDPHDVRDRAVWDCLRAHQWFDFRKLRQFPPDSAVPVAQALEAAASAIRMALRRNAPPAEASASVRDQVAPAADAKWTGTKPVLRNAPCPCGSGKKFKHCHGGGD
jgi:hypothetical protein